MPTYSFKCEDCDHDFEITCTVADYQPTPLCPQCNISDTVYRNYKADNLIVSVPVSLGSYIDKREKSEDEKRHLFKKQNAYKYDDTNLKPVPQEGMTRTKKAPWEDD